MTNFNLSEWALRHRSFVWYLMLATLIAGVLAYTQLGREEDPRGSTATMTSVFVSITSAASLSIVKTLIACSFPIAMPRQNPVKGRLSP